MTCPTPYSLVVPSHLTALPMGQGRAEALDRLAREAVAGLPRDSAAPARHRYRARIESLVAQATALPGAVIDTLYVPAPSLAVSTLPMSLACGRLPLLEVAPADATTFLVGLSHADPTSRPVDADGVAALRTHVLVSLAEVITHEVCAIAKPSEDPQPTEAQQLRATYVVCEPDRPAWHLLVTSMTVPSGDGAAPVVPAALELFDAMISTLRWSAKEAALA